MAANNYFPSGQNRGMKLKAKLINYVELLFESPTARIIPVLFGGTFMNFLYIATNAASAFIYRNIWSATLTVYHLMLIIMRIYLLTVGRSASADSSGRRLCLRAGILLLLLDLASALMMFYSISQASYASYSGAILLGFLIFTVYSVTRSVIDLRRHKDGENHLYFTARSITLSTSLMSVFNLQYSLLSLLGADSELTGRAILLCGLSVFSIILFLSLRLIRRGSGKI